MAGLTPLPGDRAAWCRERLDFFCSVFHDLDKETLKAELETCETEDDAAGLMHSLLWFQENMQTHQPEGAVANDPPDRHDLQGDEVFPEGHQPLYVAIEDPPARQPYPEDEAYQNTPMVAGELHLIHQGAVNLQDHNYQPFREQPLQHQQQQHQQQQQQQQQVEVEEEEDYIAYAALPFAMCERQALEDTEYPENPIHELDRVEDHEVQDQRGHEEVHEEPLQRTHTPEPDSVSDYVDAHDHNDPVSTDTFPDRRLSDDPTDSDDEDFFEDENVYHSWMERSEPFHDHDQQNTPAAVSRDGDNEGNANAQPLEPPSEKEESEHYFDADEPSVEDLDELSVGDDFVVVLRGAEANVEPMVGDVRLDGATGGHDNTEDDERLAQELSERLNKEERERLESDERMARELAEQMEMEERRMEEEDEELARRLADEMVEVDREQQQQQQRRQQQQQELENMPPLETLEEAEADNLAQMGEGTSGDEEMARQLEAETQMEIREEEDEKAGRVAALINMFPDADPIYLEERMEAVDSEEEFRNAVEALLVCQRTEPRMSGYQKQLKQSHAARTDDHALQEPLDALATTSGAAAAAPTAATNHVFECTICFEEEVPIKDVATCNALYSYHLFCIECIRKHVAALIGQGHSSFRCMNGYCEAEFSWRTLKRVMEPVVYRKVQERRQQEEVMAAGVDNLVSCPFCCFMIIMPDPENKVLECLNPECLKESCRMCKDPSHIPLRCEEVEKDEQKDARTKLENRMAEAMIRQCPKCGKRFVTEGGCNKMTCTCGTVMCYLCKTVITNGYSHFEQRQGVASSKCPLWSNTTELHTGEVQDAAAQGRQELGNMRLVHDPTADL